MNFDNNKENINNVTNEDLEIKSKEYNKPGFSYFGLGLILVGISGFLSMVLVGVKYFDWSYLKNDKELETYVQESDDSTVFVQYHLWYREEDGDVKWRGWDQCPWGVLNTCPAGDEFVQPWKRKLASRVGLPLVGTYSSAEDLGVIRYHFELAKKAGIDAMFASVYDGGWWPVFHDHLNIAEEVGMKLGVELYEGVGWDRNGSFAGEIYPMQSNGCQTSRKWLTSQIKESINQYKDSSAGAKVDGKPIVWLANYPKTGDNAVNLWNSWYPSTDCPAPDYIYPWGNVDQLSEVLNSVEGEIGTDIFVLMTGFDKDNNGKSFVNLPEIGRINNGANIGQFWSEMGYENQISAIPTEADKTNYMNNYNNVVNSWMTKIPNKLSLHLYAGFDERSLFPTNADRLSGTGLPRAVISRSGNGMFEANDGFVKFALDVAKSKNLWVSFESWNDWNEQHQLEPGFAFSNFYEHGDYFSALRRIAEFKGISNPDFHFPSKEIMDPLLVKYNRYKQFEGERVKIGGRFGFLDNETCGDGVSLGVSYVDDYLSYSDPSYEASTKWNSMWNMSKDYDGILKDFEVDITNYLDVPALVWGMDSGSDPNCDNIGFVELWIDWYGERINLLDSNYLSEFNWHTPRGQLSWSTNTQDGTAVLRTAKLEDGVEYNNVLNLHPNWDIGGFVHTGINWFLFEDEMSGVEESSSMYDLDGVDGVDIKDLVLFIKNYFVGVVGGNSLDFNGDGDVNLKDYKVLVGEL